MAYTFHLSIPVSDLERARAFYVERLGCTIGREAPGRFDLDFFGHHVVVHLAPAEAAHVPSEIPSGENTAPVRHFGIILPLQEWRAFEQRLADAGVAFSLAPHVHEAGSVAEQQIMMFPDGCGNVVELKSIPPARLFESA